MNRRVTFAAFAVLLAGRLPSFFEPHWYTDEAGYTTTAKAILDGKLLYASIWNNKPPLHLWTVAFVFRLFGPSEAGLHLLTFFAGAATLGAIVWAAPRLIGPRAAAVAVLVAAVLLALPVLDAELAIPEALLAAPAAWAGALLLVRLHARGHGESDGGRWPLVVGFLAAVAVGYQQTALADAVAFALILAISPLVTRRELLLYVAALALPTAAWVAAVVGLAGGQNALFALAGFYVPYAQYGLPAHDFGRLLYAAGIVAATALCVAGGFGARRRGITWAACLWGCFALLVPAAAQRPYPHFLLPSLAPLAFALPLLLRRDWIASAASTGARAAAIAATAGLLVAAGMAHGAGLDWIPPLSSQGYNGYRTLSSYYVGFVSSGSLDAWQDQFDSRVAGDRAVAAWVKRNHLNGSTAVVWSSDAWLYATAELDQVMPTAPIYNDFVLLGVDGQVSQRVRTLDPDLIIVADQDSDEFPEIRGVLLDGYRPVYVAGPDTVWLRIGLPEPMA